MNKLAFTLLLLVPFTALAKGGGARTGIDATNKAWMAAVEKGDAAGAAAAYTADGKLLPPGHDLVSGSKDIQAFFGALAAAGIAKIPLTTTEVFDGGGVATEVGTYQVLGKDGKVLDTGKYIVLWKNDGGKWKLHRDMWNSNAAPAAPAPASAPAK
jgi:uncharacterized protein (TIGR02246 family)